jgi:hypothetical protein
MHTGLLSYMSTWSCRETSMVRASAKQTRIVYCICLRLQSARRAHASESTWLQVFRPLGIR